MAKVAVCKYIDVLSTETFIEAHVDQLKGATLIQGRPPRIGDTPPSIKERVFRALYRHVGNLGLRDGESEHTPEYMRLFRSIQPDVVLAEYGMTGVAVCDACQRLGIPYVTHFHGFDAHGSIALEKFAPRYPSMLQSAAAVIGVSQTMCSQLVNLGAPKDRVFLNPCGVDIDSFEPSPSNSLPVKFLGVGRFVDKKAPHLTILAFSKLLREYQEAQLHMIGDGPLLSACMDLVSGLDIEDFVTFHSSQPHKAVRLAMQSAHVFVQHSITAQSGDSEGSPVSITEAGASGLPVVSTFHAGIPDIVIDEETGFLVNECDVENMARRMAQLARDPKLARSMGLKARKRIEMCFSNEQSTGRLNKILQWAAGMPGKMPPLVPDWLSPTF